MAHRENFTAERVALYVCPINKQQAFFWDAKVSGFGLRVTAAGARAYVFESRLHGKTIRLTIGDQSGWTIPKARERATELRRFLDQGIDPRVVETEKRATADAAKSERERRTQIFGDAWDVYVEDRKPKWGERHYLDHVALASVGGLSKKRGGGITMAGPLASLRPVPLVELTGQRVAEWLESESATRPTRAALAYRQLRAFFNWSSDTEAFAGLMPADCYKARAVKDAVPRVRPKEGDVLQREQLRLWFAAVRALSNPVIAAYLQSLLLTGARREELAGLRLDDVDFRWNSLRIRDKIEGDRVIPLTPFVASLLLDLKRRNETPPSVRHMKRLHERGEEWEPSPWVFASVKAEDGKLAEPRIAHNQALDAAGLPHVTLHGLRRSFGTLSEWCEVPVGVVAQIMGHAPSALAEKHYRRRPIDLLRSWHERIERWIIEQAGIEFDYEPMGSALAQVA